MSVTFKFGDNSIRGLGFAEGQIYPFVIDHRHSHASVQACDYGPQLFRTSKKIDVTTNLLTTLQVTWRAWQISPFRLPDDFRCHFFFRASRVNTIILMLNREKLFSSAKKRPSQTSLADNTCPPVKIVIFTVDVLRRSVVP